MAEIYRVPQYDTKTFCEVFPDVNTFLNGQNVGWHSSGLYLSEMTDAKMTTLYYLLYARFGNSPIANYDQNQFRYKVWALVYQYGPAWSRELDIQANLRGLTVDDIQQGAQTVYNHAYNPSDAPATGTTVLPYINDQNVTNFKKGLLEGYAMLEELLKRDVTSAFLDRFKNLFLSFVGDRYPYEFVEEED